MNNKYCYKTVRNLLAAVALLGGGSMLLTSCEDTLDMPSYTKDDTDFVFQDENKAEIFIQGIYTNLIHEEIYRQGNTGDNVTLACEDDFVGSKYYVGNYSYDVVKPYVFGTTYNEGYKRIEACNLAISRLKGMEQTAKVKALIAEAVTLRAYVYFNLIRYFGDVPFNLEPLENLNPNAEDVKYPTRCDRDKIYDAVIDEMVATIDDMPWQSECGWTERLTRNSAKGILARICLHAAGYSLRWDLNTNSEASLKMAQRPDVARIEQLYRIADSALNDVISRNENSLVQADNEMNGFQRLFYNFMQRNYGSISSEMMWSLAKLGPDVNSTFGVYVGQPGATSSNIYGQRRALQTRNPLYYLSFDPKDTRRDVSCGNYTCTTIGGNDTQPINVGTTFSTVTSTKFRIQWGVEPQAAAKRNVNIPMLRYSDILLMYAETQNHLNHGPSAAAKSALQQVRDRAGVGHLPIPTSEDAFLETLLQERQWEFADEFLVRTDLVRMNLLDKVVTQAKQDIRDLSKKTGKYANVATYRLYKLTEDENKYGTKFLTLEYIDLTDQAEINLVKDNPNTAAKRKTLLENTKKIAKAHGMDGNAIWYPCNMFQNWGSTYNRNCRLAAGFKGASNNTVNIGNCIALKNTGFEENGGKYPDWIDGEHGLFFGYKHNKTELSPFAAKSTGHPLVDNPRLTQLPGYMGYTGL